MSATGSRPATTSDPVRDVAGRGGSSAEKVWDAHKSSAAGPSLNIPIALNLKGRLDTRALERAFGDVVRRHDTLRTVLAEEGGRVNRKVLPDVQLPLTLHQLPDGPARTEALAALLAHEADAPFDLATGPLVRIGLVPLSDDEHILLLTIHHLVFDRWSSGVLFRELAAAYEARAFDRTSTLTAPAAQYETCASQQRAWLASPAHDAQLQYWKAQLRGPMPIIEVPSRRPRPASTYAGRTYWFDLPERVGRVATDTARRHRVTPFMLFLATFMLLLHRYTGEEDICVSSVLARRRGLAWEGVVGLLMNGILLRAAVRRHDTCETLLKRVRDTALGAYDNQDVPFGEVLQAVTPSDLVDRRRRQASFHSAPYVRLELAGIEATPVRTATSSAGRDFVFSLHDGSHDGRVEWHGDVEYSTDLFDESDIVRLVGDFERLLVRVCEHTDRTVEWAVQP